MPRARGHSAERGSLFNTYVSGVTFQSNPSGTTIVKSGVTATVVSTTNINATKITGQTLVNAGGSGFVLPYVGATGLLMDAGQIANGAAGVTKVDAAYFGFAAIYFCLASVGVTNVMNKSGTSSHVHVTTSKAIPATGVSRVYFRVKDAAGAAVAKPCSVQYFAIGV